ncbi:MAG: hypothetical protein H5T86_11895 [Armatimonadetes bacterium]|nr:hypothetical protein [Armatimonadota bacterium]
MELCVEARAVYPQTDRVEVTLIQEDGAAYGTEVPLTPSWQELTVPLGELRLMWNTQGSLNPRAVREISVVFGAWLYGGRAGLPHGVEIRRITLKPAGPRRIRLFAADGVLPLVAADGVAEASGWQGPRVPGISLTAGAAPGRKAVRLTGGPFGPEPDCVSIRYWLGGAFTPRQVEQWRRILRTCDEAVVSARAGQPHTTAVEIVFIEEDGAPWGTVVDLTDEWRTARIPLSKLKFFSHWGSAPEGRGGPGDCLRPENLSAVNICFGAWLFPDHREELHAVEIEAIGLLRSP